MAVAPRGVVDLGTFASYALEVLILPAIGLPSERHAQAEQPIDLLDQSRPQLLHDSRLVADRETSVLR